MRVFFFGPYLDAGGRKVGWRAERSQRSCMGGFVMHYGYLLIAVALEVSGTMLLPASQNFSRPIPTVSLIGCYAASFYCLTFALNTLPIAVVYATWSGLGIFLITLFGYVVFHQSLDWRAIVGLLMIVAGVVLVNTFAPHK